MTTLNDRDKQYILISETTGLPLKKLLNEAAAADLIRMTHRQMLRWREAREAGKIGIQNPPYYVIDGVRKYERDLLLDWLVGWNEAELYRKRGKKAQSQKVVEAYFAAREARPLIEGEQKYRKLFKPDWMSGLTEAEIQETAYRAQDEAYRD